MTSTLTEDPATTHLNALDTSAAHLPANTISAADDSTEPEQLRLPASEPNVSSSTGLSGATANDTSETIGHRVSKRSLRRKGSATSSKRSYNAAGQMSEKASRPMSSANAQASQPRAKKKSKFLSFLCCGSPDESGEPGQELSEAPRQTATQQTNQTSQQSPTINQSPTSAPEPTTNTASSVFDEKSTPAYASNGPSSAGEKEKVPVVDLPATDKPMPDLPANRSEDSSPSGAVAVIPPRTSSSGATATDAFRGEASRLDTSVGGAGGSSNLGNPDVIVQAPTPVVPQNEEELISDRTPAQQARDTDIEMTDVGPSLPLSSNDVSGTSEDETRAAIAHNESQKQIDLPPPPPLEERQAQVAHEPVSTGSETGLAGSAEPQKWLLPPLRPELKGRKCLVLDLDETLVHSSFKVRRVAHASARERLTLGRFFIKQISLSQSR